MLLATKNATGLWSIVHPRGVPTTEINTSSNKTWLPSLFPASLSPVLSPFPVSWPSSLSARHIHYLGLCVRRYCYLAGFILSVSCSFKDTDFGEFRWHGQDSAEDGKRQDAQTLCPKLVSFLPQRAAFYKNDAFRQRSSTSVRSRSSFLLPNFLICQWELWALPCLSRVAAARSKWDSVHEGVSEAQIKKIKSVISLSSSGKRLQSAGIKKYQN